MDRRISGLLVQGGRIRRPRQPGRLQDLPGQAPEPANHHRPLPDDFPGLARDQARTIFAEFTLGRIRPQSITYSQPVDLFLAEKRKSRRPRTADDYQWLLSRVPFKGQLSELTHQGLQRRLARVTAEGTYNHVLVVLRVFFNWAIKRRYIEHNQTLGLAGHARATRSRVLSDAELQSIWRACERRIAFDDEVCGGFQTAIPDIVKLPRPFAAIVKLLILTGQRRGEIAALRTDHISNGACTLPSTLTKNKREHSFPMGPLATSLLSSGSPSPSLFFPLGVSQTHPLTAGQKVRPHSTNLAGLATGRCTIYAAHLPPASLSWQSRLTL
jgi:integrase